MLVEGLGRPPHRTLLLQEGALCSQYGREPRKKEETRTVGLESVVGLGRIPEP